MEAPDPQDLRGHMPTEQENKHTQEEEQEEDRLTSCHPDCDKDAAEDSDNSSSNPDDEDGEEEEEEEDGEDGADFHFDSDEAAEAVRQAGLKAYNESRYSDALDEQYRVVRYFSEKYGATSPQCGKYFLDYGLSQLRLLQGQKSVEDALQPRDEDALETCYINLEVARVALQKVDNGGAEAELAVAEVHNALAQLCVEQENFEGALRQYEVELLMYRGLQEEYSEDVVPVGRLVAVLYGIADCYMKEGDFEGAEERLKETLDEAHKHPAGTIDSALIEELEELLEDSKDMKGGKFQEIQDTIKQQFAAEAEALPTAREFYEVDAEGKHPFFSTMPGGGDGGHEGSFLSMPTSINGTVLGHNEHSNSQSISLFPQQGSSRSGPPLPSGPIQQNVAVRKKPKNVPAAASGSSMSAPASMAEPDSKKARTE